MKNLFFEQSQRDNTREAQVTPHKAKPQCGGLPHKRCAVLSATIIVFLLAGFTMRAPAQVLPTWESLNQRGYPQWFSDAKLGIFIHWGLYSVPAYASKEGYGEWFYRGLMQKDAERMRIMSYYADTTKPVFDQYKELTKYWHAELWDPNDWADLFKYAGAKYVVLVTKHHDGYCLWDSPQQPQWNSVASGPKRNIVEELTTAVRDEGMRMGFYYSLPEWTNPRHIWMQDPDSAIGDYVDNYMVPQFKDLVTRYKPDLIFSDGDWNNTAEQLRSQELISWYYNTVGKDAIVNNRWGNGTKHGFLTPEYSAGIANTEVPWAECRGLGRSFGLNRNEDLDNYLTDQELIQHFVELVAHGGGLTLNVGPNADGTIPLIQQERLKALGKWLEINGEAIYGTRPYEIPCQQERSVTQMPPSETIDFDWVRNAPLRCVSTDHFTIHWSGEVVIPEDGQYTLTLIADDKAFVYKETFKMIWDNVLRYDKDASKNPLSQTVLTLQKGEILPLLVEFQEKDLEASISLKWSKDGEEPTPIPANWDGGIYWDKTVRCFTTKNNNLYIIEFERPDCTKPLQIYNMPKINPKATFRLLEDWGYNAKLKWKQDKDGTLTIDFSSITQELLNHLEHAWVIEVTEYK